MARNPNRMQENVDRLMVHFSQRASATVTYQRGTLVIRNISATPGRKLFDVFEGDMMIAYESRDYLIKKADLTYLGLQLTPESGDIIIDNGRSYAVMMPKPHHVYESIGPDGTVFKIHTKAVQ